MMSSPLFRPPLGRAVIPALVASLLLLLPASASPQGQTIDPEEARRIAEQYMGAGVTPEEILRRLQESGMTQEDVRLLLQQRGYDPSLADQYFEAMEGGRAPERRQNVPGAPSMELVEALRQIGLQLRPQEEMLSLEARDSLRADSIMRDSAMAEARRSRIFGKTLFARASEQFEPMVTGPISRDYRLGPGDEVWLILSGDVERAYRLSLTREGFLIIPQVGEVPASGLTLEELEDRLYTYLGRAYSGVRRGPEASTRFQVSVGELRPSHVFVAGEVERPSGYAVSPMARVFNALYRAGGPNEEGSFRRVVVRRDGRTVGEVDLYPYLLAGESADDIRLEQGDMVFVPLAGPRVTIEGEVRRAGIYELLPGEGLQHALAFAGGVRPEAVVRRVQIDRVLPPSLREPGKERTLLDVDIATAMDEARGEIPLEDGDIITLFSVSEERRNRVAVSGGVRKPGQYEWTPGMTLSDLVENAEGLDEGAYTERALIYRLQQDRTRRMLRSPLTGDAAEQMVLADRDSVVVLREDSLRLPMTVEITGFVKNPGSYPLAEDMSVRDLVLEAGGFREGADVTAAEVARNVDPLNRSGLTADVRSVPLTDGASSTPGVGSAPGNGVPDWRPEASEFALLRGDRVYVRRAPGYGEVRTVRLTGEVMRPGEYELGSRQTRISDVITRAGGVSPEAYLDGFKIVREGRPITGNLTAALRDPGASGNILLEPGDSLHVPAFDGTVNVTGAVLLEANVLYARGRSLEDYIDGAGGFTDVADRRRVVVTYPNGEREVMGRFLFFEKSPAVKPGSSIFVPTLPQAERDGVDWGSVISRSTAVMSALATLYLAINR